MLSVVQDLIDHRSPGRHCVWIGSWLFPGVKTHRNLSL